MRRFNHIFAAAALVVALAPFAREAHAGRLGGPASGLVTIPAYQSYYVDVPFLAGQAVISTAGEGPMDVGLFIYDSEGNVVEGAGLGGRKTAVANVERPGFFRVEVRNNGPLPNTVLLGTN